MTKRRINGTIEGHSRYGRYYSSLQAEIVDAICGGLCKIHGRYYGHGKQRDCPYCDIEEYFKKPQTIGNT